MLEVNKTKKTLETVKIVRNGKICNAPPDPPALRSAVVLCRYQPRWRNVLYDTLVSRYDNAERSLL